MDVKMTEKTLLLPILKYDELNDLFKCGVCKIPLFCTPIHSCKSVKAICKSCFGGYYQPGTTHLTAEQDDAVIQRAYWELASLTPFPCCFPPCEEMVRSEPQKTDHYDFDCQFKKIRCPLSASNRTYLDSLDEICDWQGSTDEEMVRHIQEKHAKYILQTIPPKVYLSFPTGTRRLYFIINEPHIISLMLIERSTVGVCIGFRQNRPSENIDVCYYEMIPSGKKGMRFWSYLFNATMYGKLSNPAIQHVVADDPQVLEFHIKKVGENTYPEGYEKPDFYCPPDQEEKMKKKGCYYVPKSIALSDLRLDSAGKLKFAEEPGTSDEQTEPMESKNKAEKTTGKASVDVDPRKSVNEIEETESEFEIMDEVPKPKLEDESKNNSSTDEFEML